MTAKKHDNGVNRTSSCQLGKPRSAGGSKATSKTLTVSRGLRKTSTEVGTRNVRTLLQGGKLENINHEMPCLQIYILGVWMCESDFYSSDFRIIHSRGETHQ